MDNLQNKIMQYFHDRLVANGIDPAEIKGRGGIKRIQYSTKDVFFTQSIQHSYFNTVCSIEKGTKKRERCIKLETESAHPTDLVETKGIPDLSTILATMIVAGEAKKFTISIAAQETISGRYESGGKVVLNEKGIIQEVKDIPTKNDYMHNDLRAIVRKGRSYQTAIGALVDHFCDYHMPKPRHRVLWKDKEYATKRERIMSNCPELG